MESRRLLYGGAAIGASSDSNLSSFLLQNQRVPSSQPLDSLFFSGSSTSFRGSRTMVSFKDVNGGNRSDRPFFCSFDQEENEDEGLDEYFHQPVKKRRLTDNQVLLLEKSFEAENKLEPERKITLAKDLGLEPRQVAIWFQNRRARWRNKQLEKDYEALETSYNRLKDGYDHLLKEKEKLKTEVLHLTDQLLFKENENSELSIVKRLSVLPKEPVTDSVSEGELPKVSVITYKQEDLFSATSDIFDSDSPHYTDGVQSSLIEPGVSSHVFEPDQSDLSQDEEDNLSKTLLPIGDGNYPDPPAYSSYFGGLPFEDHAFSFWSS